MVKSYAGLVLGLMIALPVAAAAPAVQPAAQPAAEAATETKSQAEVLAQFRDDLQAAETEIVSKAISLTTEEATAFWPVFKEFQREQKAIIDGQIAAVSEYSGDYADLSDQDAMDYVNALLTRDEKIHDLRVEYLAKYAKVISPGSAARVIHISRRLGLASQAKLATAIPLVR